MDRHLTFVLAALTSLTLISPAHSATGGSDADLMGFDAIVNQLSREGQSGGSSRTRANRVSSGDPFESILIHGGVGLTTQMQTLSFDDGSKLYLSQKGVQAAFGIDLFSSNWMAEGTVRSFDEANDGTRRVSLKEFELKLIFKDRFSRKLGFKAAAGLTGRYLTLRQADLAPVDYTTPSSVASLGLDFFLSERFSIGAEVSARNALIAETIDRSSYDAGLRLDTHF